MKQDNPSDVSQSIKTFYDEKGWKHDHDGITLDAQLNEDLRDVASEYISQCRLRVKKYINEPGTHILDMASGPIQYPEYLTYSENYKKRHCVDLSEHALTEAEKKIGEHGDYYCGDFLKIPFENDFFDCSISCHTLYHIHKDKQKETVDKLIDVTKEDKNIIIVYSNPNYIFHKAAKFFKDIFFKVDTSTQNNLYHFTYPISFWNLFKDKAYIHIVPWRSMSSRHQKLIIPNNLLGRWMFKILFQFEETFPLIFIRFFKFYMVVLRKIPEDRRMRNSTNQ